MTHRLKIAVLEAHDAFEAQGVQLPSCLCVRLQGGGIVSSLLENITYF